MVEPPEGAHDGVRCAAGRELLALLRPAPNCQAPGAQTLRREASPFVEDGGGPPVFAEGDVKEPKVCSEGRARK